MAEKRDVKRDGDHSSYSACVSACVSVCVRWCICKHTACLCCCAYVTRLSVFMSPCVIVCHCLCEQLSVKASLHKCVCVCAHRCTCMYVWWRGRDGGERKGKERHDINNSRGL